MSPENIFIHLVDSARKAETDQDWVDIDHQIEVVIRTSSPEVIVEEILPKAKDEDPKVRDTSASIFAAMDHIPENLINTVGQAMIELSYDIERYPAGRAVTFLLKNQSGLDPETTEKALTDFKSRVNQNDWKDDLLSNIPDKRLKMLLS